MEATMINRLEIFRGFVETFLLSLILKQWKNVDGVYSSMKSHKIDLQIVIHKSIIKRIYHEFFFKFHHDITYEQTPPYLWHMEIPWAFQFQIIIHIFQSLLGSIARTFGRIRMMRQIIVPLTFIGGFLTAIIIGIKITGVFNVILVTKVLMLQLALILGKLLYGLKDLFSGKVHHPHPQPVYHVSPPQPHYYHQPAYIPYGPSHGSSYGNSYGSSYGNSYGSQSHASAYASSREDGLSSDQFNAPQFNRAINQLPSFNQPQQNFQPQMSPFSGIALQAPQQIQYTPQLFTQPFTRLQSVESYDQRILNDNYIDDNSQLIKAPKSSLSPQELTKVLYDAIAQVSSRTTASPLLRAIQKRWPNIIARNSR